MPVAFGPTGRFPAGLLAIELPAGDFVVRIHHRTRPPVFFGPKPGVPPQNRSKARSSNPFYAARPDGCCGALSSKSVCGRDCAQRAA